MLVIVWMMPLLFISPLRDLLAAVQRVQAGDLSARVAAVHGLGEVTELAQAFDRMADTLQQRESERRQMEQRFRAAFESSAIGMGLMTLDGDILAVNAAVCQMSGYTEEELRGRNDRQNVYPPDADVGMDLFAEMLAGKRGYYSVERRYVRKNGEVFWARLTLSLVRDAQGAPAYLVGMVENIDEQKSRAARLAEEEKQAAERLAQQEAEYRRQLELRIAERTEELNAANERLREKAAQDAVAAERTRLARVLAADAPLDPRRLRRR